MLVAQILKTKADDGVVSVPVNTPIAEVARILSTRKIGTVVISDDGKTVQGIASERDIVNAIGRHGEAGLHAVIGAIMTTPVQTCARADSALSVIERMTAGRFRHLPVVENGEMVGLISIGDVVKARLSELSVEKDALESMIKGH